MTLKLCSTLALCGIVLIGCSKKEDEAQKAADAVSKATEQMAQQTQNATTTAANKTPGVAIAAKTLAGFLPSVSGFTLDGEPETMDMEMNGAKYTHAVGKYKNGDKRITVSIFDYNYIAGLTAAYTSLLNMNMETNDESWHTDKINGFPSWINWKKKSNEGSVGTVVNDRIFVIVEGRDGVTQDELKAAASAVNYSGIASASK